MLFSHLPNLRPAALVALCGLLILWLWCLFCWRERVFFADPAFIAYRIINTRQLAIMENRFGAFLTQGVVWLGCWLDWPLQSILFLYSGSFLAFYTLVGGILYRLRQYLWVVLLFFYQILIAGDAFYWSNNEVHQGVAWLMLYLGVTQVLLEQNKPVVWLTLALPLLFLALFSHVLVFIPYTILWLLAFPYKGTRNQLWTWWLGTCVSSCFMALRYFLSLHSHYDSVKLLPIKNLSLGTISGVWTSGHLTTMRHLLLTHYWLLLLIFLIGLFVWIYEHKWWPLLCWLGALVGYVILICIVYPDAFERPLYFYIESEWQAFGMLAALPFAYSMLTRISRPWVIILVLMVFISRWPYLYNGYLYFHKRYKRLEYLVKQYEGKKVVIQNPTNESRAAFIIEWGLPVESLLLSQTLGHRLQTSIKISSDSLSIQPGVGLFYGCFELEPVSFLNSRYFRLESGPYAPGHLNLSK